MQLQKENLGKVSITVDKDYWDTNRDYDRLVIVTIKDKFTTYISRKPVPAGIKINNREYWIPFSSLKEEVKQEIYRYKDRLKNVEDDLLFLSISNSKINHITYKELYNICENSKLIPGDWYRIVDYKPTVVDITDNDTFKVIYHPFDILVLAVSEYALAEEARALPHNNDYSYYGRGIHAWKLWYTIYNDTDRFAWADTENGRGIIYRMIDEYNNDCGYDFKNILCSHGANYHYTFSNISKSSIDNDVPEDLSVTQAVPCNNNIIKNIVIREEADSSKRITLPNNILFSAPDKNENIVYNLISNNKLQNCKDCFLYDTNNSNIINAILQDVSSKNSKIVDAYIDAKSNFTIYDDKIIYGKYAVIRDSTLTECYLHNSDIIILGSIIYDLDYSNYITGIISNSKIIDSNFYSNDDSMSINLNIYDCKIVGSNITAIDEGETIITVSSSNIINSSIRGHFSFTSSTIRDSSITIYDNEESYDTVPVVNIINSSGINIDPYDNFKYLSVVNVDTNDDIMGSGSQKVYKDKNGVIIYENL